MPFWRGLYCAVGGFCCWLIDRLGCDIIKGLLGFYPQFHAMWHVLIFGAAWNTTVFMFYVTVEEETVQRKLKSETIRHRLRPILFGTHEVWEMV